MFNPAGLPAHPPAGNSISAGLRPKAFDRKGLDRSRFSSVRMLAELPQIGSMLATFGKAAAALVLAADVALRFRRCVPKWVIGSDASETAATIRDLYDDASYWPTPWLGGFLGGEFQTIWYGLNPFEPEYSFTEDVWQTPDGGTLGLAWPEVPSSLPDKAPIVIILPGLCGSIKGTGNTVQAMIAAGLRPVCFHARGCGQALTSPCFNLFGNTNDLREAIARIQKQWEGVPLCIYSISAGTAFMVRYLGEEGTSAPIVAGVANCPGYDIAVCMQRVGYLYDSGFYLGVLKRHWLSGSNGAVLQAASPEICQRMEESPDIHSFMVAASPFAEATWAPKGTFVDKELNSGTVANAFATYLANSNPMGVAHNIQVPAIILNADDDPVCCTTSTDDNAPALLSAGSCSKTVLLRYGRGGHCCFARGLRAQRWSDELGAGFLAASARKQSASAHKQS